MTVIDGRTWLEHLNPRMCWQLLATSPIGRVGVLIESAPEIYPVNFVVDDDTIVFRTDPGSKLRALDHSPSVCFEVDHIDLADRTGWSVLVKGTAAPLSNPDEIRKVKSLPLEFWPMGEKSHWIRVRPSEVTGRRIHPL